MEIKDGILYSAFGYCDFGTAYLVCISDSYITCEKLLRKNCKRFGREIVYIGNNQFKLKSRSSEDNEIDYFIRKIKINKLL